MRASVLVVGVLGLAGVAHADSPRVGFANAARSVDGAQTIIESLRMGVANEGFRPLSSGAVRSALEDPFVLTAPRTTADAVETLQKAKDSYASFEYGPALRYLQETDDVLRELPTTSEVVGLIADRYLLAGLVFAGRNADAQAAEAFRVVARLDPQRTSLDAGVYRPAIVKMYKKALSAKVKEVKLEVTTEPVGAEVWIDGKMVGPSPVRATVARGLHRIAANAEGHQSAAKMLDIGAKPDAVTLALQAPSVEKQIHQLRSDLSNGPGDDGAWKLGAEKLTALAGTDLMVVVRNAGEGVFEAAIFRKQTGELGRWIPVPSSRFYTAINPQTAADRRRVANPPRGQVPPAALSNEIDTGRGDKSWYSTWWGRSLIVGTAAIAVGAVVFAVTRDDGTPSVDIGDWCFGMECAQ